MDAGQQYKSLRAAGLSKDHARRLTMRDGWQDEVKGLHDGLNVYSEEEARLAIVHARQDISIVCSDLGELLSGQRRLNTRLNVIVILLVALLFVLIAKPY
jgi:hypothetical protein